MKPTLVFGAGGRLGGHVLRAFPGARGLTRRECDITDAAAVRAAVAGHGPAVIINCAAMTNVAACEVDPASAWNVNVVGAKNVAEAGGAGGAFVVHFSSDYAVNPLNVYGRTKLASESVVNGLVVRCKVYDRSHWLFRALMATRKVRLLTTSRFNPITVCSLLRYVEALIERRHHGVLNIGVVDALSYYDFGVALCDTFGFCRDFLEAVGDIETAYPYPKDTYLDVSQLEQLGFPLMRLGHDMETLKHADR